MDIRKFFSPPKDNKAQKDHDNNNVTKKTTPPKDDDNKKQKKDIHQKDAKTKRSAQKEKKDVRKSKQNAGFDDTDGDVEIIESVKKDSFKSKGKKKKTAIISSDSESEFLTFVEKEKTKKSSKKDSAKISQNKKYEIEEYPDEDEDPLIDVESSSSKDKKRKKSEKPSSPEDELEVVRNQAKKRKLDKKKKGTVIFDSDSDEEPIPGSVIKQEKKPRRKKKDLIVVPDSDDDAPRAPGPIETAFIKAKISSTSPKRKKKSPEKPKGKPITMLDFFGCTGIQQSNKTLTTKRKVDETTSRTEDDTKSSKGKEKKKIKDKSSVPTIDESMEIHDDEDFERTLLLLDEDMEELEEVVPKKKAKKGSDIESVSSAEAVKENGMETITTEKIEKPSLAKKLASKAIKAKVLVEDTPEKPRKKLTSPAKKQSPPKKSPVKMEVSPTGKKGVTPNKPKPEEKTFSTEKKKSNYYSYQHRGGPQALGSKEIPEGGDNCLEGLTFLVTGILDSIERDEAHSLIERYGGKVMKSLSRNTKYMVVGREAGESKLQKAIELKTKQIDEDGLFDLLRTLPGKKSKYVEAAEKEAASAKKKSQVKPKTSPAKIQTPEKASQSSIISLKSDSQSSDWSQKTASPQACVASQSGEMLLWVDKYKPQSMKQIIGQSGDKSNAKKLYQWLINWSKNRNSGKKFTGNRWNDDGSSFKAALLSGPPGIGKTTTASLVCKEAGFTFVELNASDTRNKKSLQQEVAETLKSNSLMDYMATGKRETSKLQHCMLMDEVDGMAGNQDRGGIAELIQLIKKSQIPIICMCNDRASPKIRSLVNYCYDLRFQRPRVEQIKSAMMSIAFKEGLKVAPPALNELIMASNQDVRQVIHHMEMFCAKNKSLTYDQAKQDASSAKKDLKIGSFEACRKVFASGAETAGMTLNDKAGLFFMDYSIMPLFVQENYVAVRPLKSGGNPHKHLSLLSKAADSICDGDLVGKAIRGSGKWGLLPTQAFFSSVIPGEIMRGTMGKMIAFPSWLGKNSSQGKTDRILQELSSHMRLKICANKTSLNTDYRPFLKTTLTKPLLQDDSSQVNNVIQALDDYNLLKEDFDNIIDISQWTGQKNIMSEVTTKMKSAFTRSYNKGSHVLPYAISTAVKKARRGGGGDALDVNPEDAADEYVDEEEEEDKDDVPNIKKKAAAKGKVTKKAEVSGKGKGKGRGKGKK